jgi:hypothetical protein
VRKELQGNAETRGQVRGQKRHLPALLTRNWAIECTLLCGRLVGVCTPTVDHVNQRRGMLWCFVLNSFIGDLKMLLATMTLPSNDKWS